MPQEMQLAQILSDLNSLSPGVCVSYYFVAPSCAVFCSALLSYPFLCLKMHTPITLFSSDALLVLSFSR
jgi:hypothetical protein